MVILKIASFTVPLNSGLLLFQILIANEMACELFGFANDDLIGLQLNDLITLKPKSPTTITESHLEDSGEIVEVCGKVVDAIDASGMLAI